MAIAMPEDYALTMKNINSLFASTYFIRFLILDLPGFKNLVGLLKNYFLDDVFLSE